MTWGRHYARLKVYCTHQHHRQRYRQPGVADLWLAQTLFSSLLFSSLKSSLDLFASQQNTHTHYSFLGSRSNSLSFKSSLPSLLFLSLYILLIPFCLFYDGVDP